jgi:hypothetical protein
LLNSNGARKDPYLGSFITHVICDDHTNNSDYLEAKEVFELTIVTVRRREIILEYSFKCVKTKILIFIIKIRFCQVF